MGINQKIASTLVCFCFFVFSALSQSRTEYDKAEALAIEANKQLLAGEMKIADSLINESINLYPTRAIFAYARNLCLLPDIRTANILMDKAYRKVETFPLSTILLMEVTPRLKGTKIFPLEVREFDLQRALMNFGAESYAINKDFGSHKQMEKILEKLTVLNIKNSSKYDYEYRLLETFKLDLLIAKKEFDKAIDMIKEIPPSKFFTESTLNYMLTNTYFEKGDYKNVLKYSETFKGYSIASQYNFKLMVNAVTGNNEEALKNYHNYEHWYKSRNINIYLNDVFYYLAVIDLNKKDYKSALSNLDSTLNRRSSIGSESPKVMLSMQRWIVYKAIGDAYTGLEQYEKAKDNYTISLLANPDYEPVIASLANLENTIAKKTTTDKTAPVISLLEPTPKRGFKITAKGANVFIKGIANDPSGLKEVKINNKIVYAQKGGDFWGEIALAVGVNKLTIVATDFAGNKGEQVFEIERQSAKATEIVPVVVKEGRNYCVLIAAQNYSDNNIPSLTNPVADAVKLKLIFKTNYNFAEQNIITLFNPELIDVKRQLLELTNVLQPEDNLVIFYAGHGIWVDKEKKGYWLLTDAKRNDVNTWLPNKTVLDLIAKVPSRHTLLITDACFSGSVFKTRGLGKDAPAPMKEMDEKISRVAITSGNDTEVPDESVFMKYLVKALSENKEKYLTAQKMFITQIIEAVMTETKTEPRYGTLELAGHVGGDFIFSKK